MQNWKTTYIIIGLIASTIGVVGCGHQSAPVTAQSLILQARVAALKAHSVDMQYTNNAGRNSFAIDDSFRDTNDGVSTVYQNGTQVTTVLAKGIVYFKVNPSVLALYGQPASLCATDCGKYIVAPTSRQQQLHGQLSISYGVNRLIKQIPVASASYRGLKIQKAEVSNVSSLCVTGRKLPVPAHICVTANGSPKFTDIRWEKGAIIHLTFSHWNEVSPISVPPTAKIITHF